MNKPKISWDNWCRWCGVVMHCMLNASTKSNGQFDQAEWRRAYEIGMEGLDLCDIVESGATHHLRIDYEHLYPLLLEGGDDSERC